MNGSIKACAIIFFLSVCSVVTFDQTTISGKVVDEITGEPLISANVIIKGTSTGVATDLNGVYELEIPDTSKITLVFSYVGYEDKEVTLEKPFEFTEISLKDFVIPGEEVVVTASRVSESVLESPIAVAKMDAREIRTAPSGNFYKDLGNFADIDIVESSIGFHVINMRGFNTSQPERSVQYIDGIDNQAPGLNFAVGNLMGANDLELQSVEVIYGASSALYGANAFQGVVSMTTKDPYTLPGLALQVKGGNRSHLDLQGRYAQTFGKNNQWAFKLTGSYMQVEDWPANDSVANLYGDIETDVNASEIIRKQQFQEVDEDFTQEDLDDAIALNNWLDFNPEAAPGILHVQAPGYLEPSVADYNSKAWKISPSLHYKINNKHELSYLFKYGSGTSVYQGTNRYSIKDITFQQHKLELKGKNYFARVYTTLEDAGDSYDNVFTAINISKFGISEYVGDYLSEYFGVLDTLTNNFCADCVKQWMIDSARTRALAASQDSWVKVGSYKFDSLFNAITTNPDLKEGSKFLDKSALVHAEGQYRFDDQIHWLDLILGAAYRAYLPKSKGTIFSDTLANPADTLADGRPDPNADYTKIRTHEVGAYLQASKRFFRDKFKFVFSMRFDKNTNFDAQFSPRASLVFSQGVHNLRVSGQSAFRTPTLQDQYILLDLGPITLVGNLNGYDNLYTLASVDSFQAAFDSGFIKPELLETVKIEPLRPEQVRSIEFGYRAIHNKILYLDFNFYYNWYKDFIGDMRVAEPGSGSIAGEESGEDAIITENYDLLQIPVNSKRTVRTWGFSLGLSYYFGKGISFRGNYTYSDINEDDLRDDDLIPGFNTPKHKFNIGLQGRRIWKGLGFNTNFKWVDTYLWEAPFGDGQIPSYYLLDAQLNYEVEKIYTTFTVGSSNLLDDKYRTAYGSPLIGRMFYASVLFDISQNKLFGKK